MTGASIFFVVIGIVLAICLIIALINMYGDYTWEGIAFLVIFIIAIFLSGILCAKNYDKEFAIQMKNIEYSHSSTTSVHTN